MSVTKKGVIAKCKFKAEGKTGWKYWKIAFEDGEIYELNIGPRDDIKVETGMEITIQPGKYDDTWVLVMPSRSTSNNGTVTSSDYWARKFSYETEQRDPKIEFQQYFLYVSNIYAACVAQFTKGPQTVAQVDKYIDAAYSKAEELYTERNAKPESLVPEHDVVDDPSAIDPDATFDW